MLSNTVIRKLRTEIQTKEAILDALNAALLAGADEVGSYRLDTGEGSQQTKYRSLDELLRAISHMEATVESLYRRLNGTGLSNLNVRRKHFHRIGY